MSTPTRAESIACHQMHVDHAAESAWTAVAAFRRLSPDMQRAVASGSDASVRKALKQYSKGLALAMGVPMPIE